MGNVTIQGMVLGGKFFSLMNARYSTVQAMQENVAALDKASAQINRATMEYGQYQSLLVPFDQWPSTAADSWLKTVTGMRANLTGQSNTNALSPDEPNNTPNTKCTLLDAAIRKCFNSSPPIPFQVSVAEQPKDSPDANNHAIGLDWAYANGQGKPPTFLTLSITCPYGS